VREKKESGTLREANQYLPVLAMTIHNVERANL